MIRSFNKKLYIISLLVGISWLLTLPVASQPIVATPHATPQRSFKICLLLLQSQKSPNGAATYWNPDPWFFPVLDHSPYKPAGWTIDNPLAPARVANDLALIGSGDEYAKDVKGSRQNTNPVANGPLTTNWYLNGRDRLDLANQPPLTRNEPAYWAVKLDDKSIDALANFDLLVLNVHAESKLSSSDNRYLRILLDRGATIWVNDSQRSGAQINNLFLDPPVTFETNPTNTTPNTFLQKIDVNSWLLNGQYSLTDTEVNYLRDNLSNESYISSGVAGMSADNSVIKEVVRLMPKGKPLIAAGNVGAGEMIFTCSDVMGGISDWWENIHNNSWRGDDVDATRTLLFNDLTLWPSHISLHDTAPIIKSIINPTNRTIMNNPLGTPKANYTYAACSKFVFNMLARPANWYMVGGNAMGTRAFPQDFASVLQPAWAARFAPVNDPVSYGNYLATTGWNGNQSELRVYELQQADADQPLQLKFPVKGRVNLEWKGSPVFSKILRGGVPVTVIFALGYDNNTASLVVECYQVDSTNGDLVWSLSLPTANAGTPLASLTISNNRLVVTTFGESTKQNPYHIFLINAETGITRAWLGDSADDAAQYRFTGPASLVTVQLEFEMTRQSAGDTSAMPASAQTDPNAKWRQVEAVECLAAAGEYYSTETAGWQAGIFLLPARVTARGWRDTTPQSLTITASGIAQPLPVGTPGNSFRSKNVVQTTISRGKDGTRDLVLTLRSYEPFFKTFDNNVPLSLPLTLGDGMNNYSAAQLSVSAPVFLRGSQRIDLSARYSLRTDSDNTGNLALGYLADNPPLLTADQLIFGSNTVHTVSEPLLRGSNMLDNPALDSDLGGALTAYRLSLAAPTSISDELSAQDKLAWQFYGNTFGPLGYPWNGAMPYLWRSDFPYPSAINHDLVYTIGLYQGYGAFDDTKMPARLAETDPQRAVLYALDPKPARYLRQTVSAGVVPAPDAGTPAEMNIYDTLIIAESVPYALRNGVRAIIQGTSDCWDMGRVKLIRKATLPSYYVEFDRPAPSAAWLAAQLEVNLLVATSSPYVSHIQGWNTVTGAEVIRCYLRNGTTMLRLNEGISTSAGANNPALPKATTNSEVMIAFNNLQYSCHVPDNLEANTVKPLDADFLAPNGVDWLQWNALDHLYLPRTQQTAAANEVGQPTTFNYRVDYRSGRIELSPSAAGEFADRFVVVHYFTREVNAAGLVSKVRHAEIMHVPSQILWQYQFTDAIPDSGPVLTNNTVYISVMRKIDNNNWQPAVYAFSAIPTDPNNLRPLSVAAVGPVITTPGQLPYRSITTPVPNNKGILVGTADKNSLDNELVLLADRGLLISDAQRILRINGDGQVTWQASATRDIDPKAPAGSVVAGAAVTQQAFVLITKIQRLNNGNILVCDTGGNRVVEMDRDGQVVWQSPAGALSGPRDVRRYQTELAIVGGTRRYETTIIADSGNQRIVEFYSSMTKLNIPDANGPGYHYRLDLGDEPYDPKVVADGTNMEIIGGKKLKNLTFTQVMRYTGENDLIAATQPNGYASNRLLAVVGNQMEDPEGPKGRLLHTVIIQDKKIIPHVDGRWDTLVPRPDSNDFVNIRQLDLITLKVDDTHNEVHVLVVDQSGVREFPLAAARQQQPVFEMRQEEYSAALVSANWEQLANNLKLTVGERAQLLRWRNDALFAPVAVQRIDSGSKLVSDQAKARYLISQMNTLENPNPLTWMPDANGQPQRRIFLFEARYLGNAQPYVPLDEYRKWGIVDGYGRHYLFPTPWATDYPNIPGSTYPISQPLSFDRD